MHFDSLLARACCNEPCFISKAAPGRLGEETPKLARISTSAPVNQSSHNCSMLLERVVFALEAPKQRVVVNIICFDKGISLGSPNVPLMRGLGPIKDIRRRPRRFLNPLDTGVVLKRIPLHNDRSVIGKATFKGSASYTLGPKHLASEEIVNR